MMTVLNLASSGPSRGDFMASEEAAISGWLWPRIEEQIIGGGARRYGYWMTSHKNLRRFCSKSSLADFDLVRVSWALGEQALAGSSSAVFLC